ncbi:MAG: fumarylacetoacetase [Betaproteobacteria bacterium]|nr:fumarylacetoacetase [Betaproteobacteria bacterium]MDE2208175.1 fumarylacetoacetase [Betaproteobacteria bacterium]
MHPNDPRLNSFIPVERDSHFPIQNLPFGMFTTPANYAPRAGVAIGSQILDLAVLEQAKLLEVVPGERVFNRATLNAFIERGPELWSRARAAISDLLRHDNPRLRDDAALRARAFVPAIAARMLMPISVPGYTDFYSSKEHATNVGSMFRDAKHALLPNWLHLPIAYNGRASSVVVSGTPVLRPNGQTRGSDQRAPVFGPSAKLDFELETAFIVGAGNELGEPVPIGRAASHVFGMVLMNDWSARDIQQWEYIPLGPFNSKSFATSISPWIVTMEALQPFRVAGPPQDPSPLSYLETSGAQAYDIRLEASLAPAGKPATTICRTNLRYLYWSIAQQLAHHTVSGCNLRVGDLMGSGTISGPTPDSLGSLLELTWNGSRPIKLDDGSERCFLEDDDEVIITGYAQAKDHRVGFGEVRGRVVAARAV